VHPVTGINDASGMQLPYLAYFECVEILSVLDDFGHRVLTACQLDRLAAERPRQGRLRRRHRRERDDHLLGRGVHRYVRFFR